MKLLHCRPRGFCGGVMRAIAIVNDAITKYGPPIYVRHEIVHNRHVVNELREKGAIFVEHVRDVPKGQRMVISAHGAPPEVMDEAKHLGIMVIDATCPLVKRVHSAAERFAKLGFQIILIGHRHHAETIGTKGVAPDSIHVVESISEIDALTFLPDTKIAYLTQTTWGVEEMAEMKKQLLLRFPHIITTPGGSICQATQDRQMVLRQTLNQVDLVLVVGDPMSSNSRRLCEVAHKENVPAFLIQQHSDIQKEWLKNVSTIVITSGASTPEFIVQESIHYLQELGVTKVEEIGSEKKQAT